MMMNKRMFVAKHFGHLLNVDYSNVYCKKKFMSPNNFLVFQRKTLHLNVMPQILNQPKSLLFSAGLQSEALERLQIKSGRLFLRPVGPQDVSVIFSEFTEEITRYMLPAAAKTISETEAFVNSAVQQRKNGSDLILAILNSKSQEFYGLVGLHQGAKPDEPVFGIWLKKSAHGQGYGREAVQSLLEWGRAHLNVSAFIYPVDRANIPSRKIPESLGGSIIEEKIVPTFWGGQLDEVVFRIPA